MCDTRIAGPRAAVLAPAIISTVGFAPTKELERVVNQWHEEDVDCPAKWHVLISVMLLLSVTGAVLRGVGCCVSFTALRVGGKKAKLS